MGRRSSRRPRAVGLSRRDFLRRSGRALLGMGGLGLLSSCGGGVQVAFGSPFAPAGAFALGTEPADARFLHGVASGDPLNDRVILWTRVSTASDDAVRVQWQVALDPGLRQVIQSGDTLATPAQDFTVKVDVSGLAASTTYYYRFACGPVLSPVGRTRSLPLAAPARSRIAVASCASLAHGYFNAYRRIAERADLDLVLHLGDYIYEYGSGQFGNVRPYEPPHETLTLADYRARYAQYRRDADLQEMHRQHPLVAIWDDHEFADNAWTGGAANHNPATEGAWNERVAAALQAWHEWMPVRVIDPADLRQRYRQLTLGPLADLFLAEERLVGRSSQIAVDPQLQAFRQAGAFLDPARQMMGSAQEAWLAERMRASQARWKLLAQGTMLAQLKIVPDTNASGGSLFVDPDQWDGYEPARQRLFALFKGDATHGALSNVVVLSGDLHSSWAAELTPDPNNANVASGGYDPGSGAGALAVEFVNTSVTSPALGDLPGASTRVLGLVNPHFKYIELQSHGYMLLDIDPDRVLCEWWYVDLLAGSTAQRLGNAMQVSAGQPRLLAASASLPPGSAPPLAP